MASIKTVTRQNDVFHSNSTKFSESDIKIDPQSLTPVWLSDPNGVLNPNESDQEVTCIHTLPDLDYVAAGRINGIVTVWAVAPTEVPRELKIPTAKPEIGVGAPEEVPPLHTDTVTCIFASDDWLITAAEDLKVQVIKVTRVEKKKAHKTSTSFEFQFSIYATIDHVFNGKKVWPTALGMEENETIVTQDVKKVLTFWTGGSDGVIRQFAVNVASKHVENLALVALEQEFNVHTGAISSICVGSKQFYSADVHGFLKVWNKTLDTCIAEFQHPEVVSTVCISHDHVFTACADGRIRMFEKNFGPNWKPIQFLTDKAPEVQEGSLSEKQNENNNNQKEPLAEIAHRGLITCMKLFGNRLYSSSYDSTLKVWHVDNGQPIQVLDRSKNSSWPIKTFAVGADRLYMGEHNTIVSWIPSPGDLWIKKKRIHKSTVKSMLTDEHFLITTGDHMIKLWDKFTMEQYPPNTQPGIQGEIVKPETHHEKPIKCLTRDGKILYSGSDDTTIKAWLVPSKQDAQPKGLRYLETLVGHDQGVTCIAVDESRVYAGSIYESHRMKQDNFILIWSKVEIPTGQKQSELQKEITIIRTPIAKIDISYEGRGFSVDCMTIFQNYLYCGVTQTVPNNQYIRILNKLKIQEYKSVALHPGEAAKLKYKPQQPPSKPPKGSVKNASQRSSFHEFHNPDSQEPNTGFFGQLVRDYSPFVVRESSFSMKSYGTLLEHQPDSPDDPDNGTDINDNNAGIASPDAKSHTANPNLELDEVTVEDWKTNRHRAIIRGIHVEKGRMITVSDDGSLKLWTQTNPDQDGYCHWKLDGLPLSGRKHASDKDVPEHLRSHKDNEKSEAYDPNQGFHGLFVDDYRIYAASENQILIFHKENRLLLQRLEGHASVIWSLTASDGIVYSGSYDRTVRSWKPERVDIQNNAFFQHCAAPGTRIELFCDDNAPEATHGTEAFLDKQSRKNWKNITDLTGRNALTVCAATGNVENAIKLLQMNPEYDLSTVNSCGESSLFYALREKQWDFIENLHEWLKKRDVLANKEVKSLYMPDSASVRFITDRAVAGDEEFFKRLFSNYIRFDLRPVLAEAIRRDQLWLIDLIPQGYNSAKALHAACFFGKPEIVSALLQKKAIRINEPDSLTPKITNITAVDICHLGAEYSELNFDAHTDDWPAGAGNNYFVKVRGQDWKRKEWIPSDYWDEYEYALIQKRNECFQRFAKVEEVSLRPDWTHIADDGKRPYDRALELHGFAMEKMKTPKLEISDRVVIDQSKALFDVTARAVVYYQNKVPEIQSLRARYANLEFAKQIALYLVYLILLTSAGLMGSVNMDSDTYYLSNAVNTVAFGDDFASIASTGEIWNWIDNTLIPAFSGDPPFMLEYNLVVGAVQLRQLKVKSNSCHVRSLYKEEIPDCYARVFSLDAEDKSSFGPNNKYHYKDSGDAYWASDDIWYPGGGFIEELPTNDADTALNITQSLQENEWLTPGTRLLLVTWTVYNANLRGSFAISTAEFNFNPSGQISASSDVAALGPYVYDTDVGGPTGMKYCLELIVFLFIIYEFMWTEIHEIGEAIETERIKGETVIANIKQRNEIHHSNNPIPHNRPVLNGLKAYLSMIWNYYEWFIILLSLVLFSLRVRAIAEWSTINLHPTSAQYSDFSYVATLTSYEQDLFAVFLVLNWLRLLKFFRLQPFTGPLTQSIMDTLTSTTVIIFVAIIFYVLIIFSLTYYIAFGPDLEVYNGFSTTVMTMFQALFGSWDYDQLKDSNKVFGPVLFLMFLVFVSLVLMNLLIGVLGQAYEEAQALNEKRWNRFITNLMILSLPDRCKPVSVTKDGWFWQEFSFDKMIAYFAPAGQATEAVDGDQSVEQSIYFSDDQLDEMVVTGIEQDMEEEEKEANAKKKSRLLATT